MAEPALDALRALTDELTALSAHLEADDLVAAAAAETRARARVEALAALPWPSGCPQAAASLERAAADYARLLAWLKSSANETAQAVQALRHERSSLNGYRTHAASHRPTRLDKVG